MNYNQTIRQFIAHIYCNFQLPLLREAQERREFELYLSIQSLAHMVQTLNEVILGKNRSFMLLFLAQRGANGHRQLLSG